MHGPVERRDTRRTARGRLVMGKRYAYFSAYVLGLVRQAGTLNPRASTTAASPLRITDHGSSKRPTTMDEARPEHTRYTGDL